MTENKTETNKKKSFIGKVISNKMDKTAVIQIERTFLHSQYSKVVKRFTRLKAHDQDNKCQVGDQVKIIETRPMSKDKHWKVIDIISSIPQKSGIKSGE